jgi:hypothetical protein
MTARGNAEIASEPGRKFADAADNERNMFDHDQRLSSEGAVTVEEPELGYGSATAATTWSFCPAFTANYTTSYATLGVSEC